MQNTPKSLRIQLALTGRVNSGKSTLLNLFAGQDVAIISPERGTTTDVVEKAMELRPIGPVLFLDTAGIDDESALGAARTDRTLRAVDRADVLIIVTSSGIWGSGEEKLAAAAEERKIPFIIVVNEFDGAAADRGFLEKINAATGKVPLTVNAADMDARKNFLEKFTALLIDLLPDELLNMQPLLHDLVPAGGIVLMMVPIDIQAPKGRLILPQVQAVRDALDGGCICMVAKENAFPDVFDKLAEPPALVVCDSQAVDIMVKTTPPQLPCTTFSILMSRLKGDIAQFARGAAAIASLRPGDKIIVAEACTHHASDDDIGRVKIPALLAKKAGGPLDVKVVSGSDFPDDLSDCKVVLHCGGCMLNRRAMLNRLKRLEQLGIPAINYGMAISVCKNVVERVLTPFPDALESYRKELEKRAKQSYI